MKQTDSDSAQKPDETMHRNTNRQDRSSSQVPQRAHLAYYQLIEACKQKDLDSIKVILSERPDLANQRDQHSRTLFHYAAILVDHSQAGEDSESHLTNGKRPNDASHLAELDRLCIDCFTYLTDRCDTKLWWQQDLDGLSVLHLAVISSNVSLVRHIIFEHPYSTKYPLVCTFDNELHSPLHWAVITNNLNCVKLLISYAGTKLAHEPDLNGATPLHYATQTRDYPKYQQQLRMMLKSFSKSGGAQTRHSNRGTFVTSSTPTTGSDSPGSEYDAIGTTSGQNCEQAERSATVLATRLSMTETVDHQRGLEVLEYLVTRPQINLECMDKDRRTPLLWAASSGNRDAILLLVSNGANATTADINRLGALHCAASHGYTDCLECLLNLAGSSLPPSQLEMLVNQPDNLSCTPIFYSVLSGNIDCVETLLERGAKQDWQDSKGRTAAHFAALKGQLNSLKLLHHRGANLWLPNKQGDLPLHYAIKSGRQQVAKWLLEHSPYERAVNAINNFGRAPIHLAVMKNNAQMTDYLIGCGANLNQLVKIREKGTAGRRAFSNSRKTNDTDAARRAKASSSTDEPVDQLRSGANHAAYHYETALDMAKNLNHTECLQLLLDNNALTAAQVIRDRFTSGDSMTPPARRSSLFDLHTAENPSPIGFDTSSSNGSPSNAALNERKLVGAEVEPAENKNNSRAAETALDHSNSLRSGQIPKLPTRPAPDALPQTDSTESSALSQNSLTSLRGVRPSNNLNSVPTSCRDDCCSGGAPRHSSLPHLHKAVTVGAQPQERSTKPYKGGISYNNEHINASIKCKLYKHEPRSTYTGQNHSFPLDSQQMHKFQSDKHQPLAPIESRNRTYRAGQEIITNVNVYTSPCPHCVHQKPCEHCRCSESGEPTRKQTDPPPEAGAVNRELDANEPLYSDETSHTVSTDESEPDSERFSVTSEHLLPGIESEQVAFGQPESNGLGRIPMRHLPPSQNHEQHLPVIMSDQERSASGASNELSQTELREADENGAHVVQSGIRGGEMSMASVEPVFDKSQRGGAEHRAVDRYRQSARSPVADYIHGNSPFLHHDHPRSISSSQNVEGANTVRAPTRTHHHQRQPDFSRVRPKVDSHRPSGVADDQFRSKSMSVISNHSNGQASQPQHLITGEPDRAGSRSSSRHTTVVRRRGSSVDSDELATSVGKAIRKYRQEKNLFEELQNLKRNQIRSGRANEALLVKRLAEHFRGQTLDLIGLQTYHGPYTYKSYERYLYDQLRKLSQSNCAKLTSLDDGQIQAKPGRSEHLIGLEERDFIEEDLRADLELRQLLRDEYPNEFHGDTLIRKPRKSTDIINEHKKDERPQVEREKIHDEHESASTMVESDVADNEASNQADDGNHVPEQAMRKASVSSVGSSRRSSIDVEREKLLNCRMMLKDGADPIEDKAESLSSSIITDALNNIPSRASTPKLDAKRTYVDSNDAGERKEASENEDDADEGSQPTPTPSTTSGRRRSVVNIGNKVEVIYHDVGIEIDAAADHVDSDGADEPDDLRADENLSEASPAKEMQPADVSSEQESSKTSYVSPSERLADVSEAEEDEHHRSNASGNTGSDKQAAGGSEQQVADFDHKSQDSSEKDGAETASTKIEPEESSFLTGSIEGFGTGKLQADARTKRSASGRRASSPIAVFDPDRNSNDETGSILTDQCSSVRSRRASLVEKTTSNFEEDNASKKIVFNGYDLDELHRKRTTSRSRTVYPNETETGSKAGEEPQDDGSRGDDSRDRLQEIHAISPTTIKRRKERSRFIKGKYKPRVPIAEVKRRWFEIKSVEMQRKRALETGVRRSNGSLLLEPFGSDKTHSTATAMTKSQPNLEDPNPTQFGEEKSPHLDYVLLYEVNKGLSSRTQSQASANKDEAESDARVRHAESQSKTMNINWCHKKIVKIVDVRTLKRTLSLPDSLIYSNNLLKRFNILKL